MDTVAPASHDMWPLQLFEGKLVEDTKTQTADKETESLDHGKVVRCAYCRSIITYQANAEQIQGSHVHSFTNPSAYEFTIACYRRAWCKIVGLATLEWSWFAGFSWQYALCPQCQEHLGWYYSAAADDRAFYGLIIDRLIIEQAESNME